VKPSLVLLTVVAILVVAVSASSGLLAAPASSSALAKQREIFMYGHVKSLTRKGARFELRFDPAWWLTGLTARRAALQDTGSTDVPNDYYIVEEGHRLLTFVVPTTAQVSVLTRQGVGTIPVTTIPVSELAQIVKGKNPQHRQLMEPKAGFWIRVAGDAVRSFEQQYQP
jgi:hypothetical protein